MVGYTPKGMQLAQDTLVCFVIWNLTKGLFGCPDIAALTFLF